jgi:hypothetical protein
VFLESGVEAFDQSEAIKGLRQEASGSGLHDARMNGLVREGRNENEWQATSLGEQKGLQFNAAHEWHLDIRDHARRVVEVLRPQELVSRSKCMDDVSKRR